MVWDELELSHGRLVCSYLQFVGLKKIKEYVKGPLSAGSSGNYSLLSSIQEGSHFCCLLTFTQVKTNQALYIRERKNMSIRKRKKYISIQKNARVEFSVSGKKGIIARSVEKGRRKNNINEKSGISCFPVSCQQCSVFFFFGNDLLVMSNL